MKPAPGEGHWPGLWGWAIALGHREELLSPLSWASAPAPGVPSRPLLHRCIVVEAPVSYGLGGGGFSWSRGAAAGWAGAWHSPTPQNAILSPGWVYANHGHVKLSKQEQKGGVANKSQVKIQ